MTHGSELADMLIEQSPDAIIFADLAGLIRVWNAAAERTFGFSKSEAFGKSLDIIIPERFREAHWRGFERAIAERVTKYVGRSLPTRSMRSDGKAIYVELSFAIVLGQNGSVVGCLAHARDITERFEKQQAERKRPG